MLGLRPRADRVAPPLGDAAASLPAVDEAAASNLLPPATFAERVVRRVSGAIGGGQSRRSFLTKVTLGATALAVDPLTFTLEPAGAYDVVCGSGNTCGEGWSVFCCTINNGQNSCPPGSFVAGWWKADNSSFCGGNARYYIDCNARCESPCTCYCPTGTCDNRRTCCNQFRYGQCNIDIACYGPVVCRVVTCVAPWSWDPSCTTTSRTDNRTADHNAPCNDEKPPVANVFVAPGVGRNADGRLEVYALDQSRRLTHRWQVAPNGNWSGWLASDFPAFAQGSPGVGLNEDGRLEVFWLGDDNQMWHAYQKTAGGTWTQAFPLGGTWPTLAGASVASNADGRLELFTIGADRKVWHIYQVAPNKSWSGWISEPGGPWTGSPAAATNADGRLEVFTIGTDRRLWHSWQLTPNGKWSGFLPIDDGGWFWLPGTSPAATANPDGRLEVFTVGLDRAIWHNFQVRPNGTWFGWQRLGPTGWTFRGSPAAGQNADGRLEVFVEGDDRQFWHNFQIRPNGDWFGWQPFGGTSL